MSLRARFQPSPSPLDAGRAEAAAAAALAARRGRAPSKPAPRAGLAVSRVLKPLFSNKAGVGISEIKRRWAEIVGEPFASKAEPLGLRGGVLRLAAASSIAPFLQHQNSLILERLRIAGVAASEIRIEHRVAVRKAGVALRAPKATLTPIEEAGLRAQFAGIDDPVLMGALLRLGRAVSAR